MSPTSQFMEQLYSTIVQRGSYEGELCVLLTAGVSLY